MYIYKYIHPHRILLLFSYTSLSKETLSEPQRFYWVNRNTLLQLTCGQLGVYSQNSYLFSPLHLHNTMFDNLYITRYPLLPGKSELDQIDKV